MDRDEALIERLYDRFNARDVEGVFAALDDDVLWANGMDGGHVRGKEALRRYWADQWSAFDPRVDPVDIKKADDGALMVEVRQIVRDLQGSTISDGTIRHVFRMANGRVARFDIEGATPAAFRGEPAPAA